MLKFGSLGTHLMTSDVVSLSLPIWYDAKASFFIPSLYGLFRLVQFSRTVVRDLFNWCVWLFSLNTSDPPRHFLIFSEKNSVLCTEGNNGESGYGRLECHVKSEGQHFPGEQLGTPHAFFFLFLFVSAQAQRSFWQLRSRSFCHHFPQPVFLSYFGRERSPRRKRRAKSRRCNLCSARSLKIPR